MKSVFRPLGSKDSCGRNAFLAPKHFEADCPLACSLISKLAEPNGSAWKERKRVAHTCAAILSALLQYCPVSEKPSIL